MTRRTGTNRGKLAVRDASSRADAHRCRGNTQQRIGNRLDVPPNLVRVVAIDISLSRNRVGAAISVRFVLEEDSTLRRPTACSSQTWG